MNATRSRAGSRFGPYELRSLIGRGGMGEVYEAYDTHNDRVVALKLLPAELAQDPTYRERFRRESHAATRIADPHIVPINRSGEIEGTLYLDMRLIRGDDLRALLRRQGAMDPERAVHIVAQVGAALDAAHAAGLVHRDVKPANVLVTPTDFAFLTDFGIARSEGDSSTTMVGITAGSYTYMAPERFDSGPITGRADTYSLACVLFECLTGATPFAVQNVSTLIRSHLSDPPPRPSLYRPDIPEALDAVIAHAMSKSPADRFASTGEFAGAARAAVGLTAGSEPTTREYVPEPEHEAPAPSRLAPGPGAPPPVPETTTFQPFGPQGPTIAAQFQPRGEAPPEQPRSADPMPGSPTTVMRSGAPSPGAERNYPGAPASTTDSPAGAMPRGPVPSTESSDDTPGAAVQRSYTTTGSLRIIAPPSPEDRDTGSDLPVITPTDATQVRREEFQFTPLPTRETARDQAASTPRAVTPAPGVSPQTTKMPVQGLNLPASEQNPSTRGLDLPPQSPALPQRKPRDTSPRTELLPSPGTAGPGRNDVYRSESGDETTYMRAEPDAYGEYDRGDEHGRYEHGGYPLNEYQEEPHSARAYNSAEGYDHAGYEHASGTGEYGYSEAEYAAEGEYAYAEGEYHGAAGEYGYAQHEYGSAEGEYEYAEGEYAGAEGEYEYAEGEYGTAEDKKPPAKRSVALPVVLSVLGIAVAVGAAVIGWQVLGKPGGSTTTGAANVSTAAPVVATTGPAGAPVTSAADTTTSAARKTPPAGATVCRSTSSTETPYTKSAVGSGTTCGFAEAVRKAYAAESSESGTATPSSVVAVSPATGKSYTLSCTATGRLITCTGGDGAMVYLY
ncbi:serine/threonine protein kinase [Nocardia sp. GAS34]|uniref:serine/threonine-protein kinase n=1 Tax=unclassified Nocardia TaxID=2637762 RepID=UPI003D23447E